jgi:hypothetical protein
MSFPRKRESRAAAPRSAVEIKIEIPPGGIHALDKLQLPATLPFLQLLLSGDGLVEVALDLVPDKHMHVIPSGEARKLLRFVLMNPARQIINDADIERPVSLAARI